MNLSSTIFTLVGLNYKEITDYRKLSIISSLVLKEGLEIIQASGIKEHKIGNLPGWRTIKMADKCHHF